MDFFLKGNDDAVKSVTIEHNKKQWRAILGEVKVWVAENWWRWRGPGGTRNRGSPIRSSRCQGRLRDRQGQCEEEEDFVMFAKESARRVQPESEMLS